MQSAPETVERLRSALAAGDFAEVDTLLPTYCARLLTLVSSPTPVPHTAESIEDLHNLLSLARVMRAHISSQLSAVRRDALYNSEMFPAQEHAWRFEG